MDLHSERVGILLPNPDVPACPPDEGEHHPDG